MTISQQLGISRSLVIRELRASRVTVDGVVSRSGSLQDIAAAAQIACMMLGFIFLLLTLEL